MSHETNKKSIIQINKVLSTKFGFEGWWPIGGVYRKKNYFPKDDIERFEISMGAILTQNTAWLNASKALESLRQADLLDPTKLLNSENKEIANLIRSSGYYNQKTIKIKSFCLFIIKNPYKKLSRMRVEKAREMLLTVHGIGRETADSILLYALGKPTFVIDSYTKRIFIRLGIVKDNISYDELKEIIEDSLPKETPTFNELHAYFVRLAKEYCMKIPNCHNCPIRLICERNDLLKR